MADTLTPTRFDETALPSPAGEPDTVRDLRKRALEAYRALPVPSQETEEWRYTDLSGLDLDLHPFAQGGGPEAVNRHGILAAVDAAGERAGLQIQRNSEVISTQLSRSAVERGVILTDLDAAGAERPELVEHNLHSLVSPDRTKFTALHAAFRTGGTFVYVPRGVAVTLPLQTLTYLDAERTAVFPHTVLVAEEGSEVTYIDRMVSPDLGSALSDAVVEIHAGPGAHVRYVSLQDWGSGVTHLSVQRAEVGRDAEVRSLAVAFGGDLSRTEVESVLAGPGGHSEMLGLYFTDGAQHFDHRSLQDHVAPNCTSDLLYKGALKDTSRVVYSGLIHIAPGARGSDAFQTNRNIVLSDEAKADSIPNLEIENNEVRCSHAASVGPVDDDQVFYLQSRGIPRDRAEQLIVTGFFQEVLDRVPLEEVRAGLESAIVAELRGT
ncbi:MAG: Fe-S cluster assembly protein SufD [Actinomycetota bacterium]